MMESSVKKSLMPRSDRFLGFSQMGPSTASLDTCLAFASLIVSIVAVCLSGRANRIAKDALEFERQAKEHREHQEVISSLDGVKERIKRNNAP